MRLLSLWGVAAGDRWWFAGGSLVVRCFAADARSRNAHCLIRLVVGFPCILPADTRGEFPAIPSDLQSSDSCVLSPQHAEFPCALQLFKPGARDVVPGWTAWWRVVTCLSSLCVLGGWGQRHAPGLAGSAPRSMEGIHGLGKARASRAALLAANSLLGEMIKCWRPGRIGRLFKLLLEVKAAKRNHHDTNAKDRNAQADLTPKALILVPSL